MKQRVLLPALLAVGIFHPAVGASIHPRKLQRIEQSSVYELTSDYYHDRVTRKNKEFIRHTVLRGLYVRAFTDGNGDYYLGSDDCMNFSVVLTNVPYEAFMQRESGSNVPMGSFGYDCGFYLPHNTQEPVRLFYVTGTVGPGPAKAPRIEQGVIDQIAARSVSPSGTVSVESAVGGALGNLVLSAIVQSTIGRFKFVKAEPNQAAFDRTTLVPVSSN